jgi:subtilase family serine protease
MASTNPFCIEPLESRTHLSATVTGMTPAQIRHAYNIDRVQFSSNGKTVTADGSGQTIAIVDAYTDPTIVQDLKTFDKTFNLSDTDASGNFVLSRATTRVPPRTDSGWALETSLDVEWAHAIAPKAHILLVSARSASTNDLLTAIDYARNQPGVVAVSMSWGGNESPFETFFDNYLTTPAGHVGGSGIRGGVTFVTSSGDNGAPAAWPAVSPNAIAVGGTSLTLDPKGNWQSESAWSGSGGGFSIFEPFTTAAPDVAYDADPKSGFAVYDSTPHNGLKGWTTVGGTSAGAPQWAALIALVDQDRALSGRGSLTSAQALAGLYNLPDSDFHDIVTGSNGFPAQTGFDLVTGRGTPIADKLVSGLAGLVFRGDRQTFA